MNWHKFFLFGSRSVIIHMFDTNLLVIHSLHFGRAFWLDDEDQLCTCPWRKDGTVEELNWEYVSEWTDLEGLDLGKLLDIHKSLVTDAVTEYEQMRA